MKVARILNTAHYTSSVIMSMARFMGKNSLGKSHRNKTNRLKESIEFFHRSNNSIEFFHRSKFSIDRSFQSIRFNARLIYPIAKSRDMGTHCCFDHSTRGISWLASSGSVMLCTAADKPIQLALARHALTCIAIA